MQHGEQDRQRLKRVYALACRPYSLVAAGRISAARLAETGIDRLRLLADAADVALRRERARSATRHWSYDVNRHIAIKAARDRIVTEIESRRRNEKSRGCLRGFRQSILDPD